MSRLLQHAMSSGRRPGAAIRVRPLHGLAAMLLVIGLAAGARADGWVVRPVMDLVEPLPANVDVMVGPDGAVAVAHNLATGSTTSRAYLSVLDGGLAFEHRLIDEAVRNVSADMDAYGLINLATRTGRNHVEAGVDFETLGGVVMSKVETGITPSLRPPHLALDRHGVPHIVTPTGDGPGRRQVDRFDVPTGTWVAERVGPSEGPPGTKYSWATHASLAFDAGNLGVLAIGNVGDDTAMLYRESALGGWLPVAADQMNDFTGPSAAADESGTAAMAYIGQDAADPSRARLRFVEHDGVSSSPIAIDGVWPNGDLTPRSLQYDGDGLPAVVYTSADGTLALARRDAAGAWSSEALPLGDVKRASLAFDAAGVPYVAAITLSQIVLLSPGIPELIAGDVDFSGAVDEADINPFIDVLVNGHGGNLDRLGAADVDGDGRVTLLDINPLVSALGPGTVADRLPVPEPTVGLAPLAGLACLRRRRPAIRHC